MTLTSPSSRSFQTPGQLLLPASATHAAAGYDRRRHGIHNLNRPEIIADPGRYIAAIAELGPLFYDQVGRVWVCAGYQECVSILTDTRVFSSARPHDPAQLAERGFTDVAGIAEILSRQMLFTDPPDHSAIRSAIGREFTPAAVSTHDPLMQAIVDQVLDTLPESGTLDVVHGFADELPTALIASLLGLEDHIDQLPRWADAYEKLIGSVSTLPHIKDQGILPVLAEASNVLRSVAARRLAKPGSDLISRMVEGLSRTMPDSALDVAVANCLVMVAGGYQTLTHLVSTGLLLLDSHPEQQHLLRQDPSLAASAVDEIMRLDGSSQYVARRALSDTVISGVQIRAGETVIALLAAANLDSRQFTDPRAFKIHRREGRHLGFGRGKHYCIGAPYAERMAQHALTAFLRRYSSYRLASRADALTWGPHANTRCPAHLWIEANPELARPARERSTASARERYLLTQVWTDTAAPLGPWRCWHQVFEQMARISPDTVAVEHAGVRYRYGEIDEFANALAWTLRSRGVEPESVIAVVMDRSVEMVVAMLAIAKAGGAFLLADAQCPTERLATMMREASVRLTLTDQRTPTSMQASCTDVLTVELDGRRADRPRTGVHPGNTAYVVFTSGTTGRPKGIAISHEGVVNLHRAHKDIFRPGPSDRVLQFLSPSWDGCVYEVVMALLCGATLVVVPAAQLVVGPPLVRLLQRHRITIFTCTPSVWSALPAEPLPDLRIAAAAGERLPAKTVARWRTDGRRFLNLYGPAEAAVWSSWHECDGTEDDPPIGRPIPNKRLYVLDERGEIAPIGEDGELCVAGVGIGRYLARPELMESAFAEDPFDSGQLLYRTGDICRWRDDGVLEYRGRRDRQTKIRGQRVELDEVERVLQGAPGVLACTVEPRNGHLAARVVADEPWDEKTARAWLRDRLHSGMVPTEYERVAELPRTLTGKAASSPQKQASNSANVTSPTVAANPAAATRSDEPGPSTSANVTSVPIASTIIPAAGTGAGGPRQTPATCTNVTSVAATPFRGLDEPRSSTSANVTSLPMTSALAGTTTGLARQGPATCVNVTSSAVTALTWQISRMFAACLQVPQASVKTHSDFFDIGGDSLTVAELLTSLERDVQVVLDVEALLSSPTPSTIADLVSRRLSEGGQP